MRRGGGGKPLEVAVFDHELLAVLFKVEPHPGNGNGRAELERIVGDRVEVEELDAFQGSPGLFPAPSMSG